MNEPPAAETSDPGASELRVAGTDAADPDPTATDSLDAAEATNVPETPELTGFESLALRPELLTSLVRLGYEEPTAIQRETIPLLLEGGDLVGQAATGTGKTAAFALPILNRMPVGGGKPVTYALVLVPTRELAVQVSEAMYKYGRDLGAKVLPIYGGQPIGRQLHALHDGVHVVVATPGRALDHIARGTLKLDSVEIVVLDEADEMLDMGFADEIEGILDATPSARQTVLFSATLPPRINSIAKKYLRDPRRIQVGQGGQNSLANTPRIRQSAYIVQRAHKPAALGRILDVETPTAAIVFCRTRDEVDQLTETMNGRGYRAEALHGGMSQEQRDRVMGRVRNGTAELLMATDVAARGLDIDTLTHVVNYDVPSAPEAYVHRIGRVGRAGREGVAITLAEPREQRQLANIERLTKRKITIEKVPTVADLRAKQIESTLNQVRDALAAEDLEDYEVVLDALLEDFDATEVALAAIKLVHAVSGATDDEREIPDASHRLERDKPNKNSRDTGPSRGRPDKGDRGFDKGDRGDRSGPPAGTARLRLGVGRKDGIRPQDLVWTIANETNLVGKQIGPIWISEHFSTVGVPEKSIDEVIGALQNAKVKGKRANVRRYVDDPR
jgi:ATP-dependent RNA helicase DeaD